MVSLCPRWAPAGSNTTSWEFVVAEWSGSRAFVVGVQPPGQGTEVPQAGCRGQRQKKNGETTSCNSITVRARQVGPDASSAQPTLRNPWEPGGLMSSGAFCVPWGLHQGDP